MDIFISRGAQDPEVRINGLDDVLRIASGLSRYEFIEGVNLGYENDMITGADGKTVLESMPSGCYEITEARFVP